MANIFKERLATRTETVYLIDENEHRETGGVNSPREAAGLGLHALHGGDDQHDAIEHAQRPLDLGDKVRVSRGVNEIDLARRQVERYHGGLNGDAARTFQLPGVGLGGTLVHTADRFYHTGLEKDAFGEARLTGVYMRHNTEIDNRHAPYSR